MRAVSLLLLLGLAAGSVLAQNNVKSAPARAQEEARQLSKEEQKDARREGRLNQRTQRIQVEDAGSRVDELRIGGQTQNITVQPKTGTMPEYEVQPSDGVRNRPRNGAETTTGPRVWNVMKF